MFFIIIFSFNLFFYCNLMTLLRIFLEGGILFFTYNLICSNNPIHSVLQLIGVYILSAMLLLTLNTEFFSFMLIIINVGAVAVLFLFVVIMLEIKEAKNQHKIQFKNHIFLIFFFTAFFSAYALIGSSDFLFLLTSDVYSICLHNLLAYSDIEGIGSVLYTQYAFSLIYAGILLLIAILGATSLVHVIPFNKIIKN